ncbi:MAG: hypothetical protein LBT46_00860 [Planctomycetaceae bacterium]|nr:hypothetical protein [Planctomycetaceae bacterium]
MMNQKEQVIKALKQNSGYATLGYLNAVLDFSFWGTKTPQASVRRIVQEGEGSVFFKIRPGLWGLKSEEAAVLRKLQITPDNPQKEQDSSHSYYQGLLIHIGNMKRFKTCIPSQDRKRRFLEESLENIITLNKIYDFAYPEIMRRASTIDVIWFNERRMPNTCFEVEHTTDIQNSLLKFYELQDFHTRFCIVAAEYRKQQFCDLLNRSVFQPLKDRVDFVDYEKLANQYDKMYALANVPQIV